jgi:hypothetical protein
MPDREISFLGWTWLMIIALVVIPIGGVVAALVTLDVTHSLRTHVATAIVVPVAVVMLLARRFGAPTGVALRLALLGALSAMVLLDLGWSGAPGT